VTHSTWVVITLDNITKHIELLLVTECVRDVEILIGQNFTELADIEYYKCGDKLQLVQTRCLNSVECLEIKNYQVEVGTTDPVAVNKPLTISARSVLQTLSKTSVRHQQRLPALIIPFVQII
jgi:hypothetical protein